MSQTRDSAYKKLQDDGITLGECQQSVYNFIVNRPSTRQEITEKTGLEINNVCARVSELKDKCLIIEEGQRNGRGILRLRQIGEVMNKKKQLSHTKMEHIKKAIMEDMNDFQRNQIREMVK